ncbi:HlyD family secretion protein [Mucilaginibacter sp. UYCu711]|uniref:HlyD family secretion protein n=1 Tax=Mucilaginibacter sp. UYCu711 TaxID=3156339 RepID=UPI003D25AC19
MTEKKEILNISKIELLDDEVQDIVGSVPSWIVNWGMTFFFVFILFLFSFSLIFQYPDVIKSSIVITSTNPSVPIIANTNGKLKKLLINNGQFVTDGDVIGIIENTANFQDINLLKSKINNITQATVLTLTIPESFNKLTLGSVQTAFSSFYSQYKNLKDFLAIDSYKNKVVSSQKQVLDYAISLRSLKRQTVNQNEILKIAYKNLQRDSILLKSKIITPFEYQKTEQNYLEAQNTFLKTKASIDNTEMQANQERFRTNDLQNEKDDKLNQLQNTVLQSCKLLQSSIIDWEKAYLLKSPIKGKVSFNKFWAENQNVTTGNVVFTVVPTEQNKVIGIISIPIAGSGKIKRGQNVHITLDNYPYIEFGMLEGKIKHISLTPELNTNGAFYTAEVDFPNGLKTTYKNILPFSEEMIGSAEIVTNKLSLFERFMQPLKSRIHQL